MAPALSFKGHTDIKYHDDIKYKNIQPDILF